MTPSRRRLGCRFCDLTLNILCVISFPWSCVSKVLKITNHNSKSQYIIQIIHVDISIDVGVLIMSISSSSPPKTTITPVIYSITTQTSYLTSPLNLSLPPRPRHFYLLPLLLLSLIFFEIQTPPTSIVRSTLQSSDDKLSFNSYE